MSNQTEATIAISLSHNVFVIAHSDGLEIFGHEFFSKTNSGPKYNRNVPPQRFERIEQRKKDSNIRHE